MECLETLLRTDPASDSLKIGVYPSPPIPFVYHGRTLGTEYWRVEGAPQSVPSTVRAKMSRVTVEVAWIMSGLADTARYTRIFGN